MINRLGIQDETGLEAFYNFTVSPWMHVTADVKYIDSALTRVKLFGEGLLTAVNLPGPTEAWVVGVRTNLNF